MTVSSEYPTDGGPGVVVVGAAPVGLTPGNLVLRLCTGHVPR